MQYAFAIMSAIARGGQYGSEADLSAVCGTNAFCRLEEAFFYYYFGGNSLNTLANCFFVGVGGLIGSVLRYLIGMLPIKHASGFPITTLIINVAGALIIGIIVAFAGKNSNIDPRLLLFLKVGICGGFTTFSTFALEAHGLIHGGKLFIGLLYAILSVVLCIIAITGANALIK